MTAIPQLTVLTRRTVATLTAAAFVAGFVFGAVVPNVFRTVEAVEIPRYVPAILIDVGQQLCKEWGRLANITRVSEIGYTFKCARHATFDDVKVKIERR